jgi:hypothetical protein
MIRLAEHKDAEAIAELIGMFVGSLPIYDGIPFEKESAVLTSHCWMDRGGAFGYVQEQEGEVIGFISGVIESCPWNLDVIWGMQYAYYVHPCYRGKESLKLMSTFENHCIDNGAMFITSGAKCNAESEAMHKMLSRRGYAPAETLYIKGV